MSALKQSHQNSNIQMEALFTKNYHFQSG